MIIELRDLPGGRKIKNISFEITFDDADEPIVTVKTNEIPKSPIINTASATPESVFKPPVQQERAPMPVPDEMVNEEF